jgi:prolipoprotein diacylglyceryltransferase
MGMMLSAPLLLAGIALLVIAYRNPQPSGNVAAT